jgi:hypothetical protein
MSDHTVEPERARRIYVASSWRNPMQTAVVAVLRSAGHEVYDFKHPRPGDDGFHWSEVMPSYDHETCIDVDFLSALDHPIAEAGFSSDFDAMRWADTCVLVLPCGRSAHLEAGWFTADPDRQVVILLDGPQVVPELMYRMADAIVPSLNDLLGWFGVQPDLGYQAWEAVG